MLCCCAVAIGSAVAFTVILLTGAVVLGPIRDVGQPNVVSSACRELRTQLQGAEVTFFAIGDWGWNNDDQAAVAATMSEAGDCLQPSFIVNTGDNFYHSGLKAADDPLFVSAFKEMYTGPSLQVLRAALIENNQRSRVAGNILDDDSSKDSTPKPTLIHTPCDAPQ